MSQSRRYRRKTERAQKNGLSPAPPAVLKNKNFVRLTALLALFLAVGLAVIISRQKSAPRLVAVTPPIPDLPVADLTFGKLVELKPEQLSNLDVAEMNLLCASGLPGAENYVTTKGLRTLDEWAGIAEKEIARNRHRFLENPAEYDHSENLFKMVILILTVQQNLGVHYDPAMIGAAAKPKATQEEIETDLADASYFKNAASVFLNGILSDTRTGTCSSMPVLYTALGRRLGFPLKLVSAKGHLFLRWDDGKERFNLEGTGGVNSFPDDYYKNWPLSLSPEEIASGEYLKSLTPAQELSIFLESRAMTLRANGRFDEALVALAQAYRLNPESTNCQIGLARTAEIATASSNPTHPTPPQTNPMESIRQIEEINRANREPTTHTPELYPGIPNIPSPR